MARSWKLDFPPSKGWMKMDVQLRDKTARSEAELKELATVGGNQEDYEFGRIRGYPGRFSVILREKRGATDA